MTKELSRKELYDLVWSKPMSALSLEYGLSDRGMAKLCVRNSIPVPPRGYWAKKDAGHPVKQPPFHPTPKGKPDRISIDGNPLPPEVKAILQEEKQRRQEMPKVEVKPLDIVNDPHKAIQATVNALRKSKPDKDGVVHTTAEKHCGISVSASCIERVISILDALCRQLEARNLALQSLGKGLRVSLEADHIEFSIVENIEKRKHIPTAEELAKEEQIKKKRERSRGPHWDFMTPERAYPEIDYVRTGELALQIEQQYTNAHSLRRNWHDGKKTVESQLDEIVSGIVAYLAAVKEKRLEDEERDRKRQREGRIRELAGKYNERENRRLKFVSLLIEKNKEVNSFQSFISQMDATPPADEKVIRMLEWAKDYVSGLEEYLEYSKIAARLDGDNLFPAQDALVEELKQLQVELPKFEKEKQPQENNASRGYSSSSQSRAWFPGKQWYHK